MTTYFAASQRKSDGRWDYTSRSGSTHAHPIGYCAGWKEHTDEEWAQMETQYGPFLVKQLREDLERRRPLKERYHSEGHATAEEAQHCHDTYLLDTALEFQRSETEQHRCVVCNAWAQNQARLRGDLLGSDQWVCDDHATRDAYEPAFRQRYDRRG
jgi:hypothetical protein